MPFAPISERRPCPVCGRFLVRVPTGQVLTGDPPQFPMVWWCSGCDHREAAGVDMATTDESGRPVAPWQVTEAPQVFEAPETGER